MRARSERRTESCEAAQAKPTKSETVLLEFCQLDGCPGRTAKVDSWLPPPLEGATGGDIAGLRLTDDAPPNSEPVLFANGVPNPTAVLKVFGYPGEPPRPDGMWLDLDYKGPIGGELLQVESRHDQSVKAQPGYSGSPVFDPATEKQVGILQTTPYSEESERDAYLIPPLAIAQEWEEPFHYLFISPNPYRQLQPFTSTDASVFFGRVEEIKQLTDRVTKQPVVIVVGVCCTNR